MMKSKQSSKSKKALVMAALVAALGGAIWLNMTYSSSAGGFFNAGANSSQTKNLGDTEYVNQQNEQPATETAAKEADYFTKTRVDREKARNEAINLLKETVNDTKSDADAKKAANAKIENIATRMEKEAAIETVIKAKGFDEVVAVINDNDVNIVVKADSLLESQILQIQDAVTANLEISLENIKIVSRK